MTTIIMSIRGRHIRHMAEGRKGWELRKTKPGFRPPYRVLLCQVGTGGRIVAEFRCETCVNLSAWRDTDLAELACVTPEEVAGYRGKGKHAVYGWKVEEFRRADLGHVADWGAERPPQSWCYAHEAPGT